MHVLVSQSAAGLPGLNNRRSLSSSLELRVSLIVLWRYNESSVAETLRQFNRVQFAIISLHNTNDNNNNNYAAAAVPPPPPPPTTTTKEEEVGGGAG